ncbi:MAG: hypothetical protein Q8R92_00130 [Deltaproteobacteria bacterium]|nr:hypothetical protein [Deltaproteobacteria bacterium]
MKQRANTFHLLKIAAGLLILVAIVTVLASYFDEAEAGASRIASSQGETFVRSGGQQEWGYAATNTVLEDGDQVLTGSDGQLSVEFPGGVFLDLQPRSQARISSIVPGPQLRLDYGTFNVVLLQDRPDRDQVRVDWARGGVDLNQSGSYRVDVHRDGLARISVLRGDASVRSADRRNFLSSGQDLYVNPDGSFTPEGSYLENNYDDFDRGILNRYFGSSAASLSRYLPSFMVGALDLARSGDWVRVPGWQDYGWRPRNVAPDWRPYSNGRWVYTGQGWTWVPDESWGYAPSHYGRWDSVPGMGWVWQPGKKYRPAWVRWTHEGDYVGWAPIGPNDRLVRFRRGDKDESFIFSRRDDLRDGKWIKAHLLKAKHRKFVVYENPDRFVKPSRLAKMKGTETRKGRMESAANAAKKAEEAARKGEAREEERARHEATARRAKHKTPAQKAGKQEKASTRNEKAVRGDGGADGKKGSTTKAGKHGESSAGDKGAADHEGKSPNKPTHKAAKPEHSKDVTENASSEQKTEGEKIENVEKEKKNGKGNGNGNGKEKEKSATHGKK